MRRFFGATPRSNLLLLLLGVRICLLFVLTQGLISTANAENPSQSVSDAAPAAGDSQQLPTQSEARVRAELLHEAFHATLQIVHHQYFHEDEATAIPAATLKAVFREMERRHGVEIRWLAVNAQPMNVDHEPRTPSEKEAAKALSAGQNAHEYFDDQGRYVRVGAVLLQSECLKCHLPTRNSVKDRLAGLLIALPAKPK